MLHSSIVSKITILILLIHQTHSEFNTSTCGYIQLNQLYYFINSEKSDQNLQQIHKQSQQQSSANQTWIHNHCHQLQLWCKYSNTIVKGSLIVVDAESKCYPYKQQRIQLIDTNNATLGLNVIYRSTQANNQIELTIAYPCSADNKVGCPEVCRTTLWTYFSNNSIGYTIAIEVIGVLFMILGVYMYRVTLVILGWATAFIILLAIEQSVVFIPGVPQQVLSNVLLITIICSFFVGYVMAYFPKAGLFCMGMWIGLIISLTLNNVALYLIYSTPQNLPLYIVLPVLCIGFGILTVCVKRKFIIFATSLIGAYICLRALSWHLGAFPNQLLYPQEYQLGLKGIVVWQFYLYVVALLILTAASSALQFWLFKKKSQKNHDSSDIDEHFDQMQNKLENQREKLIEFDNIFKKIKNQVKRPRILRKSHDSEGYDEYDVKRKRSSGDNGQLSFGQDEQNQPSEQEYKKPSKKKDKDNGLEDALLKKNKKRRNFEFSDNIKD